MRFPANSSISGRGEWGRSVPTGLIMLYSLINQAPIACARLWDFVDKWMRDFTARLAEKLRLPEDDLQVDRLSARLAFAITGAASAQWRVKPNDKSPSSAIAKQALRMFEKQKFSYHEKHPADECIDLLPGHACGPAPQQVHPIFGTVTSRGEAHVLRLVPLDASQLSQRTHRRPPPPSGRPQPGKKAGRKRAIGSRRRRGW